MSVEELLNNGHFGLRAKPIKDYEDYIATSIGLIWSKKSKKFLKLSVDRYGYLIATLSKDKAQKTYKVHRLIANTFLNNFENKKCVDHINGIKTDNNINNLRFATSSENNINTRVHKNNKLQIKGVLKYYKNGYRAYIMKNGEKIEKTFKTLEECIKWRKQKEQELHGEFAYKN